MNKNYILSVLICLPAFYSPQTFAEKLGRPTPVFANPIDCEIAFAARKPVYDTIYFDLDHKQIQALALSVVRELGFLNRYVEVGFTEVKGRPGLKVSFQTSAETDKDKKVTKAFHQLEKRLKDYNKIIPVQMTIRLGNEDVGFSELESNLD